MHVRCWDGGERAPFVLVHGLASNARLWDGVAEHLHRAGHPVAAVDQRGHGRSDKPDDGYDYATVTGDLAAVIERIGWDRPVLAGQSWGGNVVLELAARHHGVARGVACIDGGTVDLAARFPRWEECETALAPPRLNGTPIAAIERMLREMHPEWPESGVQGTLACFEVRADGTVAPWLTRERHLRILRAMWERRPREVYPDVDVPVLLLPADDGDPTWTARKRAGVAEAEALLADVTTRWFSPAHHDVHAEQPEAVADELHRWAEERFAR